MNEFKIRSTLDQFLSYHLLPVFFLRLFFRFTSCSSSPSSPIPLFIKASVSELKTILSFSPALHLPPIQTSHPHFYLSILLFHSSALPSIF